MRLHDPVHNMDALFSKKAALKRRDSLSLLFSSQKPTFATLNEKPTRYYDFVDMPASKFSTPKVDRQDISREQESQIKYACSLLAYRIEKGVPSRAVQANARALEDVAMQVQLESKYPAQRARREAALTAKTGYDSGVGLTQQPSMQTMRVLHSRCGDPSDSGADIDTRTISVFSGTRTGTSCTNTSVLNSAEPSCTQSSTHSPRQNALQATAAASILDSTQQHTKATNAFLTDSYPSGLGTLSKESNSEDTETFLSPATIMITNNIANLSSETLQTTSSTQSLQLSRVPAQIDHAATESTSDSTWKPHSRSIIIDAEGNPRLLTPYGESQRNKALQQAVLAKMTPNFMRISPAREIIRPTSNEERICKSDLNTQTLPRPQSLASKLGLSWLGKSIKNEYTKNRGGESIFGKFNTLFSKGARA
ncbi:hypothetical protein BJX70DRAFT_238860 [Aspergillus crustosus]